MKRREKNNRNIRYSFIFGSLSLIIAGIFTFRELMTPAVDAYAQTCLECNEDYIPVNYEPPPPPPPPERPRTTCFAHELIVDGPSDYGILDRYESRGVAPHIKQCVMDVIQRAKDTVTFLPPTPRSEPNARIKINPIINIKFREMGADVDTEVPRSFLDDLVRAVLCGHEDVPVGFTLNRTKTLPPFYGFHSTRPINYYGSNYAKGCIVYLDDNCQSVTELPEDVRICDAGTYLAAISPISLALDGAYVPPNNPSIVEFPLDLSKQKSSYLWKASSSLPLLVHDPEHKGIVTSAAQLFGNWTFGGKRTASLDANSVTGAGQWENGFEALATLDLDKDGKINGEELKTLALWFDANRDAVSQQGEVISAEKFGLAELSLPQSNLVKLANGDLVLQNGFLLKDASSNSKQKGDLVDWYSPAGASGPELANHQMLVDIFTESKHKAVLPSEGIINQGNNTTSKSISDDSISGFWTWSSTAKNENDQPLTGVLHLVATDDGKFEGSSISSFDLYKAGSSVKNALMVQAIQGSLSYQDKSSSIQFTTESGSMTIITKASLEDNSLQMKGSTKVLYDNSDGTRTYEYLWTAEKKDGLK